MTRLRKYFCSATSDGNGRCVCGYVHQRQGAALHRYNCMLFLGCRRRKRRRGRCRCRLLHCLCRKNKNNIRLVGNLRLRADIKFLDKAGKTREDSRASQPLNERILRAHRVRNLRLGAKPGMRNSFWCCATPRQVRRSRPAPSRRM